MDSDGWSTWMLLVLMVMCGCGVSSVDSQGLPASPGTGTGEIIFSSDEAEEMMKVRVTLSTLICMHLPTSS